MDVVETVNDDVDASIAALPAELLDDFTELRAAWRSRPGPLADRWSRRILQACVAPRSAPTTSARSFPTCSNATVA
jgi:hypothetical protein